MKYTIDERIYGSCFSPQQLRITGYDADTQLAIAKIHDPLDSWYHDNLKLIGEPLSIQNLCGLRCDTFTDTSLLEHYMLKILQPLTPDYCVISPSLLATWTTNPKVTKKVESLLSGKLPGRRRPKFIVLLNHINNNHWSIVYWYNESCAKLREGTCHFLYVADSFYERAIFRDEYVIDPSSSDFDKISDDIMHFFLYFFGGSLIEQKVPKTKTVFGKHRNTLIEQLALSNRVQFTKPYSPKTVSQTNGTDCGICCMIYLELLFTKLDRESLCFSNGNAIDNELYRLHMMKKLLEYHEENIHPVLRAQDQCGFSFHDMRSYDHTLNSGTQGLNVSPAKSVKSSPVKVWKVQRQPSKPPVPVKDIFVHRESIRTDELASVNGDVVSCISTDGGEQGTDAKTTPANPLEESIEPEEVAAQESVPAMIGEAVSPKLPPLSTMNPSDTPSGSGEKPGDTNSVTDAAPTMNPSENPSVAAPTMNPSDNPSGSGEKPRPRRGKQLNRLLNRLGHDSGSTSGSSTEPEDRDDPQAESDSSPVTVMRNDEKNQKHSGASKYWKSVNAKKTVASVKTNSKHRILGVTSSGGRTIFYRPTIVSADTPVKHEKTFPHDGCDYEPDRPDIAKPDQRQVSSINAEHSYYRTKRESFKKHKSSGYLDYLTPELYYWENEDHQVKIADIGFNALHGKQPQKYPPKPDGDVLNVEDTPCGMDRLDEEAHDPHNFDKLADEDIFLSGKDIDRRDFRNPKKYNAELYHKSQGSAKAAAKAINSKYKKERQETESTLKHTVESITKQLKKNRGKYHDICS